MSLGRHGEYFGKLGQQDVELALEQGLEQRGQRAARRCDGPLRGGHDLLNGAVEILRADADRVDVQLEFVGRGVDLRVAAAEREQSRLGAQRAQVGATITFVYRVK